MIEKTLIIHIGPYKTGSTTIQRNLASHRESLAAHGFLYAPDCDIADYLLGNKLRSTDAERVTHADWWLGVEATPANANMEHSGSYENFHRIYSCETLCEGDFHNLRRWASELQYAQSLIVAAIREPRSWMVSSFFQEAMYEDIDFDSYVAQHLKTKKYFLSRLCALWAIPKSSFRIISHKRGTDIWMDFCRVANLGSFFENIPHSNANVSPKIIESMYYALLPSYVPRYFPSLIDWSPNISEGRFKRTLLDIVVVARPLHEWARQWSEEEFLRRGILTDSLNPILEEYREAWLEDAERFMQNGFIVEDDMQFVRQALDAYKTQGCERSLLPVCDFKKILPIDASFEVIIRLLSVAIGMRSQGLDFGKLNQ